ncbi:MAG: ArsC family (seleno)protein [Phycisphaerae bacterium]
MQGFLAQKDIRVKEQIEASKNKLGRANALRLARQASKIIVAKGKKVVTFDMKKDRPDRATLLRYLLGPTGHLRAPTIMTGKTLLVGFHDEAYQSLL